MNGGQAFICPGCLKELYQCFLFRKKCQSSDEYFKYLFFKDESKLKTIIEEIQQNSFIKEESDLAVNDNENESLNADELLIDHFKEYKEDYDEVEELDSDQTSLSKPVSYKRSKSKSYAKKKLPK